jgi:4-amino-4-deoxy-L-arabinose transferase-like glycosyltransferase
MRDSQNSTLDAEQARARWWQPELIVLTVLVSAIYFTRLTTAPVCGEESRWANAAREMIATGDWIVPRQQGDVFPERPPLGSWAIAVFGLARGGVDLMAVRLPSACAILISSWLIYGYACAWTSRLAAMAAALIFATSGQVLVLGRFGESEAVFTLFAGGALLVWHWGYVRRWHPAWMWALGYSLAALGALAKGLQAPVYFVAATWAYLLVRRDWRVLVSRWHVLGIGCMGVIVGLWLVPFARGQWSVVDDIWAGLAQDRFTTQGLSKHLVNYPFETLACLLPWAPLLGLLITPGMRRWLAIERPGVLFLVVALAVTYPTVWLAAAARGRYYMPLYPCAAVLMGLAVEYAVGAASTKFGRVYWRRFLRGLAIAAALSGAGLVAANCLSIERLSTLEQPVGFLITWAVASAATALLVAWSSFGRQSPRPQVALACSAAFVGLAFAGAMINARVRGGNELAPAIADIKSQLVEGQELVSLGRVYHRFAFSYETPIRQIPWPQDAAELPPGVTYFCYDWHPHYDTEELRNASDSRQGGTTSGKLPFEWEKVAEIPCDPVKRGLAHRSVVIGRVRRPIVATAPAINPPVRR